MWSFWDSCGHLTRWNLFCVYDAASLGSCCCCTRLIWAKHNSKQQSSRRVSALLNGTWSVLFLKAFYWGSHLSSIVPFPSAEKAEGSKPFLLREWKGPFWSLRTPSAPWVATIQLDKNCCPPLATPAWSLRSSRCNRKANALGCRAE